MTSALVRLTPLSCIAAAVGFLACVGADPEPVREVPVFDAGATDGDGGTNDASEIEIDAGPPKRVFVTSLTYPADLGGYEGAVMKCNERAGAAALPTTFKPWLSVGTAAVSRIQWQGGYETVADAAAGTKPVLIAGGRKELTSGKLRAPINVDETGAKITGAANVWTNTNTRGEMAEVGADCVGFTTISPPDGKAAPVGIPTEKDERWTLTNAVRNTCSEPARLYCFED